LANGATLGVSIALTYFKYVPISSGTWLNFSHNSKIQPDKNIPPIMAAINNTPKNTHFK
jgi:hypothetical protein